MDSSLIGLFIVAFWVANFMFISHVYYLIFGQSSWKAMAGEKVEFDYREEKNVSM
jgi:hypothetical protein